MFQAIIFSATAVFKGGYFYNQCLLYFLFVFQRPMRGCTDKELDSAFAPFFHQNTVTPPPPCEDYGTIEIPARDKGEGILQ